MCAMLSPSHNESSRMQTQCGDWCGSMGRWRPTPSRWWGSCSRGTSPAWGSLAVRCDNICWGKALSPAWELLLDLAVRYCSWNRNALFHLFPKVGALLDEASGEYLAGEPCQEAGLSVGAAAGIVVAVILLLLLLALGVFTFLKKRPNRSESKFSLF